MTDGVLDLAADVLEQAGAHPHRLVVRQHGQVVGRRRWAPWSPDVASLVYSCSKTFTSAAVGIAVERGAFGYDDTLAQLWPQACTANTGPIARSITVRNALSMSTGHSAEQLLEPTLASRRPPDLNTAQTLLATEPDGRPGVDFAYNNLATWMLSRIVARHTGEDVDTIISKEVLTPIGAGAHTWVRDADGIPPGFSGLHIDAEDLSVFGQLLLDEGVHDGTRLLPEEWIAQHRVRQVDCAHDTSPEWEMGYGWQTWMSSHGYRLDGAFGQYVLIIPEVDAVIVMTNDANEDPDDKQAILQAVWDHLLPALADGFQPQPEEVVRTLPTVPGVFDSTRSVQGIASDGSHIVVSPHRASRNWTISWRSPGTFSHTTDETLEIAVGHEEWRASHCQVGDDAIDIAASGGWQGETFVARLCVVSTPHTLTLRMAPEATTTEWDNEPLNPGGLLALVYPEPQR
ncbi:serine hydrolase domain-containing protein [Cutibacterium namnetense]|uniref:Beta-lactamase n=1 Tax=[Propionibacterium] namnetense SK182B-JCVI TaxID=1051006 RepID=F9NS81_9ACTN|nr:serine hydrolase domain-containing protein [Cutibacterium namnetense]EGR98091.1 beta-lactamase [ [[Propionibacterium] namnetense SK182B-JCVI]